MSLFWPAVYIIGIPVQMANMFEPNGKLEDFMKKNNYPKSLILPAQATLCLGGGFLWPISLPIMVIIEKLNKF